jgi:subtilisin family serine protease
VPAGHDRTGTTNAGNVFSVFSDLDDSGNHDNRILLAIDRGEIAALESGTWAFTLVGEAVTAGGWDAWIQRGDPRVRFRPPLDNPAGTISIPGTARGVITVGSYVTRADDPGGISRFSSHGPTRDGRPAPTLAAPGEAIMAPQPAATHTDYDLKQGTSMAAPMVTGAVALLLAKNPNLTPAEVRECLTTTARSDRFTGTTPNHTWGAGKLDAAAAYAAVPAAE